MKKVTVFNGLSLFLQSVSGLAKQDFQRAMDEESTDNSCAYRSGDGKKCAIGHLIPDEKYRNSMEGTAGIYIFEDVFGPFVIMNGPVKEDPHLFIEEIQCCHDMSSDRETMKMNLREFAENYGFVFPKELS